MTHNLLVYGTLRKNNPKTVNIPGKIYDLGWYPGFKFSDDGCFVVCEMINVDDDRLKQLDRYEGFNSEFPGQSLYIRRPLLIPYGIDAEIYEYNRPVNPIDFIESGDWLEWNSKKKNKG